MANCPACGTDVPAGHEFCPACLASVSAAPSPRSPPSPDPVPTAAAPTPDTARAADATNFLSPAEPALPPEHSCPTHPGYPVGGTCSRCGKFVCIRCDPELASTAQPMCEDCRTRVQKDAPEGIGGWLWLPFVNLCLSPFAFIISIFQGALGIIKVTSADHPRVGLAVLIGVEALVHAGLLGYSIFTLVRFIQRRKEAPRLLIGLYVMSFAYTVLDSVAASEVLPNSSGLGELGARVARASVGLALWTPYLLLSQRVKRTFTR